MHQKTVTGFGLRLANWLNKVKYRAALALAIILLFMGLVITNQFSAMDFFRLHKQGVTNGTFSDKQFLFRKIISLEEMMSVNFISWKSLAII
jgi:hypothetical protein